MLGVEFGVVVTGVDEARAGTDPAEVVLANARAKASAALESAPGGFVLGADTDVLIGGRLLGKAKDEDGARARLEALSGRTHEVLTGLVLIDAADGSERSGVERSAVTFRPLDEAFLERYLRSGEWRDRAGSYAVQSLGAAMVNSIEGDLSNVIGLPINLFAQLAPEFFRKP